MAQWAIHEFGGTTPISLPKHSIERRILEFFLQKRPDNLPSDIDNNANLVIQLPVFKEKDPMRGFSYLPPRAQKLLVRTLKNRFKIKLWDDLHVFSNCGEEISSLIYAWMEKNGIEDSPQNWEAIRQIYYRQRKFYEKKC